MQQNSKVFVGLDTSKLKIAVAVAAIVLVPRIAESNRERSAQERRDAQAALAARVERLARDLARRERVGEDEVVPDAGHLQDDGDRKDRQRHRHDREPNGAAGIFERSL
jgi:hypothetical protein